MKRGNKSDEPPTNKIDVRTRSPRRPEECSFNPPPAGSHVLHPLNLKFASHPVKAEFGKSRVRPAPAAVIGKNTVNFILAILAVIPVSTLGASAASLVERGPWSGALTP